LGERIKRQEEALQEQPYPILASPTGKKDKEKRKKGFRPTHQKVSIFHFFLKIEEIFCGRL